MRLHNVFPNFQNWHFYRSFPLFPISLFWVRFIELFNFDSNKSTEKLYLFRLINSELVQFRVDRTTGPWIFHNDRFFLKIPKIVRYDEILIHCCAWKIFTRHDEISIIEIFDLLWLLIRQKLLKIYNAQKIFFGKEWIEMATSVHNNWIKLQDQTISRDKPAREIDADEAKETVKS